MEVKIKNNNEMIDATIEMVDGVMVVSPKEVKFEPKDGEIVTVTTETTGFYICFFNEYVNGDVYSYGGLNLLYNMLFEGGLVCCSKKLKTIGPATEEEKKLLFDKLAEEGWKWKAGTKELVKNMIQVYPKTYEECCKVLFPHSIAFGKVLTSGYNCDLLKKFGELLICRDAYWKIPGEQMGLDEPWKPDWINSNFKYCLKKIGNNIEKSSEMTISCIFAFPTEEMRDAFYENFKNLICECN